MGRYVIRRTLAAVPVLLGTTLVIYLAVYALPGDPVRALVGPNQVISPSVEAAIRERYHLDEPLWSQYLHYLGNLLRGDFGAGLDGRPVAEVIAASWPVTTLLALTAWVLEAVLGIALGTVAAARRGRLPDLTILVTTTLLMGVPYFVVAFVLQVVFGVQLRWLPASGVDLGWPGSYLLPGLVLALLGLPQIARLCRASVLEQINAEYVVTAVAKGLPRRIVVGRHVLRNSLIPVVSLLGVNLGFLLGGTVLIEGIFNLPGLGYEMFVAIRRHDGPLVVGIGTLLVLAFIVINLVVDLLYGVLDPRIRLD